MRTFVDTNVLVYAYDPRDAGKQRLARDVLRAGAEDLVVSTQVLGELYVTLTRKLATPYSRRDARALVSRVATAHVVAVDPQVVAAALEIADDGQISYWDALIVAAAAAGACDRILTEDLTPGSIIHGIRVVSPFTQQSPARPKRLSEPYAPYGVTARWTDGELEAALATYRDDCLAAGMRPNAIHSYWDYARRFLEWRTGTYRPRRARASGRPTPPGPASVSDLRDHARAYEVALRASNLEEVSVATYCRHAMFFVRWLGGDFNPGGRLR